MYHSKLKRGKHFVYFDGKHVGFVRFNQKAKAYFYQSRLMGRSYNELDSIEAVILRLNTSTMPKKGAK